MLRGVARLGVGVGLAGGSWAAWERAELQHAPESEHGRSSTSASSDASDTASTAPEHRNFPAMAHAHGLQRVLASEELARARLLRKITHREGLAL